MFSSNLLLFCLRDLGKHSIKTMERKIPVTMETDFIYFYGLISNSSPWAKLPLTSDAKRLCSFREHCAAWGSISCLLGEDRGRAGWLKKRDKMHKNIFEKD